ncbi:MAG: hypothetical protein J5I93_25090 [Pirellulaceae bacterium]|nr:hypothetical protein [Pirellulaceae bacterium]
MTTNERKLLERAVTTLLAALAFDEALRCGAPQEQLDQLRSFWVPDAEQIVEQAERMGLLDDGLDDIDNENNGDFDDE